MNIMTSMIWAIYLGLSPVYWLPFMTTQNLYYFKLMLVASAVVFSWLAAAIRQSIQFPPGMLGPAGFIILILSASFAFIQSEPSLLLRRFQDFSLGFIMMWTMYVYAADEVRTLNIFMMSSIIIGGLGMLTITSKYFGVPSWHAPAIFRSMPLSISGFGSLRTGWSNGLVFFIPYLCILAYGILKRNNLRLIVGIFLVFCVIGSQSIVGGRAGLLASLLALGWLAYNFLPKIIFVTIVSISVTLAIVYAGLFYEHLRLDRLDTGGSMLGTLDYFSAGRITSYLFAIKEIMQHPILGSGFGNAGIGGHEIHNLWLRMAVEGGVFLPLVFFYFVVRLLKFSLRSIRHQALSSNKQFSDEIKRNINIVTIYRVVIYSGILISMFEPNVLLGSFQNSALWWATAGALLAHTRKKYPDKIAQ